MRNLSTMIKEAQRLQEIFEKMRNEVATREVTATAGGGMVEVTVNGMQQILRIKIDPVVVDKENIEMLQDLIVAATREAQTRAQELLKKKADEVTGGFNVPGLF